MRKTILSAVLSTLIAAGVATPAMAQQQQYRPGSNQAEAARLTPGRNADIRDDIRDLDRKIDRALSHRAISQREANGLHRDASDVRRLYARYANHGLSAREHRTLEQRVSAITSRLRQERWDRDGRRG